MKTDQNKNNLSVADLILDKAILKVFQDTNFFKSRISRELTDAIKENTLEILNDNSKLNNKPQLNPEEMKNNRKLLLKLLPIILLVIISCTDSQTKSVGLYEVFETKPSPDLIVGKEYIISFNQYTKDPFEKIQLDTVKITGIKNGYVEWKYNKYGFKQSCKIRLFKKILKKDQQ